MAPTLRSSVPNTPNGKASGGQEPLGVTPRKAPVCSKCKRPRAGHPRSGCPYADSPTTGPQQAPVTAANGKSLVDALGSMQLQSPARDRDDETRATIRQRRRSSYVTALAPAQSVLSLDIESQEIVESLLQPGMFDKSFDGEGTLDVAGKVVKWQDALTPTRPKRPRVKMPGSMSSPSPYSSQESIKPEEAPTASPIDLSIEDDVTSPLESETSTSHSPRTAQPLARSMSIEQRETFLSSLTHSSAATVYLVPRDSIHNIHADAVKVGFYTRIILGKDISDPHGLLVVGQDEGAVKRLYEQVEVERKKSSGLRAAAGGAVVGAVGAFAGLAFA
ncbi:hypothetical protein DXG01_007700 [Tephrocybe rancida]|nr:hypothetical protein DXG01_007700 [Tephrocybe rancida]